MRIPSEEYELELKQFFFHGRTGFLPSKGKITGVLYVGARKLFFLITFFTTVNKIKKYSLSLELRKCEMM